MAVAMLAAGLIGVFIPTQRTVAAEVGGLAITPASLAIGCRLAATKGRGCGPCAGR